MTSTPAGLDVGSHTLKVLCLEETPSALRLVSYGSAPCPDGAIVKGVVADPPALGAALKALFADNEVGPRRVVLALKGPGLLVRRFAVPASDPEEMAELISWELEQLIPWAIEEVHFDYHLERSNGAEEAQEVVAVAVRREVLMGYQQALEAAGLEAVAVDHASFALENTFNLCFEVNPTKVVTLLDLGATITSIHLMNGERTVAVRDEPIGGRVVVEHVASRCGTTPQAVELFLRGQRPEAIDPVTAAVALQEAAEGVADRLLIAFNAIGYGPGGTPITDIVLGGGLARVPTVERCIAERLGGPTELLNPFFNVEYDEARWDHDQLQESAPATAVVVGLAIRALLEPSA